MQASTNFHLEESDKIFANVWPLTLPDGKKIFSIDISAGANCFTVYAQNIDQLEQIADRLFGAYLVEKAKASQANEL